MRHLLNGLQLGITKAVNVKFLNEVKRLDRLRSIYFLEDKLETLELELDTWKHELSRLEIQYVFMVGKDNTKTITDFVYKEILPMDELVESIETQIDMINNQLVVLGGSV